MDKMLPIGTVFKQKKEGTLPLMIIGYFPISDKGELFDYTTVVYPQGILSSGTVLLINQNEIDQVLHEGYCDQETDHILVEMGNIANENDD